ncbi:histone-lysine N-methyltransferase SETDB2-like isoform X1 [Scyliorhinus torazame]|uniref:histone-lysine N-methyltransferase SETDB2-like isoform X1 n=2 Tax=Scyliorhinus torazame TaxID=75743 RepID=UPI003B5C1860
MRGTVRREMSLKCGFCKQKKEEVFCGELLFSRDRQLVVHRKCLLFSSVPKESKRSKNEKLCGSSLPAIKRKLQKVTKMKCRYCHRTGASVKCAVACCRKLYHYPCVRSDNGVIGENKIHEAYRIWCQKHKTECGDSSAGSTEGIQETAQVKENDLEPQKNPCTNSLRKDSKECSICNRTEAAIDCEAKDCVTTYRLYCAASDSIPFVKNVEKGVDRLHCKNYSGNEEGRNIKEALRLPCDGCCRRNTNEDVSSNCTEENFNEEISNKAKDGGRFITCQHHPSYLLHGDGTLKDSSVPKVPFQDLSSFKKAKSFWTRVQATGSVNCVFEQINDVLNCLKQKIMDGSANDQEYLKAMILLKEAGIPGSPLSFDTTEDEEKFQRDSEEEISEKVMISEEIEAQSVSNSSLFKQTSVIKHLPSSATYPSTMEGLVHPSLPEQLTFQQHQCSGLCIAKVTPPTPDHFKGENPLQIPILCQFQRRHGKLHWDTEVFEPPHVSYKAPCGRGLRNFKEVRDYIFETQCDFLLLDFFSFNTYVQLSRTISCKNPNIYEADISRGIEPVPIPLYNAIDVSKPQYFKYRKTRLPHGYLISNSAEVFVQKCNCTDGCSDKSRCACQQLTASVNKRFKGASGYEFKRLLQCAPSGLYECNKWCKCNESMCENRVVQHGLKTRLQLFKTKKRGWGVRCMDDVDEGTFVCCYAGRVLRIVNGVENQGHNKTVNCDIGVGSSKTIEPSIRMERKGSCLDSDVELIDAMEEAETDVKGEETTSLIKMLSLTQEGSTKLSRKEKPENRMSCLRGSEISANKRPKTKTAVLQAQRRKLLEQGQISIMHSSSEEDDSDTSGRRPKKLDRTFLPFSLKQHQTLSDNQPINSDKGVLENRSSASFGRSCPISLGENIFESPEFLKQETNKQAKEMSHKKANEQDKLIQDNHRKELTSTLQRTCNGDKQQDCCYFLDATKEGNIGRFFNHSCDPNLMVQSVFVDTHDKNFPWVAFFTNRYIKAGSELTWDYRYSTGSMPEEEIPCLCGSANCRDRIV